MSKLEELVHEISFTVEKLSSRINEEKEKIKLYKERQRQVANQYDEMQRINQQLKSDIEHTEATVFRETQHSEQLASANELVQKRIRSLTKTLDDIKKASNTIRQEKSNVLDAARGRISEFEQMLQANELLRGFVDTWRANILANKELIAFPKVIENLAVTLEGFYESGFAVQLASFAGEVVPSSNNEFEYSSGEVSLPDEPEKELPGRDVQFELEPPGNYVNHQPEPEEEPMVETAVEPELISEDLGVEPSAY